MRALLPFLFLNAACSFGPKVGAGELACASDEIFDVWRVYSGSDAVVLSVDTVDAETTFDPELIAFDVSSWGSSIDSTTVDGFLAAGDDEFECTFPPADFECPSAVATGTNDVLVAVIVLGECAGPLSRYELTGTVDGKPVRIKSLGTATYDDFNDVFQDTDTYDTGVPIDTGM